MSSLAAQNRSAGLLQGLRLARYKDIVLLGQTAFHARTLELAELSLEMQNSLAPITLTQDLAPQELLTVLPQPTRQEMQEELAAWNESTLQNDPGPTAGVRAITINATQICNLHCTYCAAGGDGTYASPQKQIDLLKSIPALKKILESNAENSSVHIAFLGGEPLLFPKGIRVLCEFLTFFGRDKKIEFTFKVTTNGTVMNANILQLLEDYQIGVVISCDGLPEIQNRYRPSKGSVLSSTLLENSMRALQSQRKSIPFVGVHCVVHTEEQDLLQAVDYFKALGFDWYEFTPDVSNSSAELTAFYLNSLSALAEREFQSEGVQGLNRIRNLNSVFARLESQTPIKNHCGIGKNFMMMDAKGDFYLCPWMVGNSEAKIQDLQQKSLQLFKQDLVELHQCQTCWARYLCGGGCHFIHNNHSQKKDKSYCERIRGTMAMAIHYYSQFQLQQDTITINDR